MAQGRVVTSLSRLWPVKFAAFQLLCSLKVSIFLHRNVEHREVDVSDSLFIPFFNVLREENSQRSE